MTTETTAPVAIQKAAAPTREMVNRDRADAATQQALRALVITAKAASDDEPGASKAVTEDPFAQLGHDQTIVPPFDILTLAMLKEQNTELTPVLDTMTLNIDGYGWHLQPRIDLKTATEEERAAARTEKTRLTNFFNYANIKDSFTALRRKMREDVESTGNGYWELIRNVAGKVQGFEHIPSYQVRLTPIEERPVRVSVPILEMQDDGSYKVVFMEAWQRFRRYIQARLVATGSQTRITSASSYKRRWFKEYGDPRVYNNETGEVVSEKEQRNWKNSGEPMPDYLKANELVHFKLYSSRTPYGLPRYIGNLLSIYGARAAEEINYSTFQNNQIPSMVVMVSNGQLTQGSVDRIQSFVDSKIQGSDNYSKFLIIETEGELEGEDAGNVKLEIKPLTAEQHKDALFQQYGKNNQDNVRRAFRLPPIFVGRAEDYTRATAEASRRLADEQIFAPEREEFDTWINRRLLPEMDIRYHRFRSNSPNTTDNAELVRILANAEKTGGMTPEIARTVLEDILGRELPQFPEGSDFDPRLPFSLAMAEAVKNKADAAEPGQQVTAIKMIADVQKALDLDDATMDDATVEEVLMPLVSKLRKRLEAQIERRFSELSDDGTL